MQRRLASLMLTLHAGRKQHLLLPVTNNQHDLAADSTVCKK